MIPIKFIQLHDNMFLGGKNFDKKIESIKYTGIKMNFHPEKSMITIEWNQQVAFFHWINAASIVPLNPSDIGVVLGTEASPKIQQTFETHPVKANIAATAQLETPMGHVFKGKGHGKTRDATA